MHYPISLWRMLQVGYKQNLQDEKHCDSVAISSHKKWLNRIVYVRLTSQLLKFPNPLSPCSLKLSIMPTTRTKKAAQTPALTLSSSASTLSGHDIAKYPQSIPLPAQINEHLEV